MSAPLRFATFLSPNLKPFYRFVAEEVGKRLGTGAVLADGPAFQELDVGTFDAAFLCGYPYVLLSRRDPELLRPVAAPVLDDDRFGGLPIYTSEVIVRSDSPFGSFEDLRGASWAYNEPFSHSGYNVTRHHLVSMGETSGYFGEVLEAGYHLEAIRLVRDGSVDASAIDVQVLLAALRDDPSLADRVRIIDSLGPATIQPLLVRGNLDPGLVRALGDVVLSLDEEAEGRKGLAKGFVRRFIQVEDSDYDGIRMMAEEAEAAGFVTLR